MSSLNHLSLLISALLLENASGFVHKAGGNLAFYRRLQQTKSTGPLHAMIFAPDDWEEEEELAVLEEKHQSLGMADLISKDEVASLARMAVAFSPPERALALEDIQQVQVLSVDETRIDIQAVLCEHDGCVTLSVPVDFPAPCPLGGHVNLQDCVKNNIGQLDAQAGQRLGELAYAAENKEENEWIEQQLRSNENIKLASWWENRPEMVGACDDVRQLLNQENFQAEINTLATKALVHIANGAEFAVQKAIVAAICPSGMHMRAYVKLLGGEEKYMYVEVPIEFNTPAQNAEELRTAVLMTVTTDVTRAP